MKKKTNIEKIREERVKNKTGGEFFAYFSGQKKMARKEEK